MAPAVLRSPDEAAGWLRSQVRAALRSDSRQVRAGDGFIAWPGVAHDARRHVPAALDAGATACLVEHEGAETFGWGDDDRVRSFAGLKAQSGPIASRFFGDPSAALDVVAITGTNGKTSTAWWLAQALGAARGRGCGVIGTLGTGQPPALEANGLTTPDPVLLQRCLRRFADDGFAACAIEASSIGLAEHRLDGTRVAVAVFTNFTHDHLDYHGSMAAYWQAKRALFDWPGLKAAVVNLDDPRGAELVRQLDGRPVDVWTVSSQGPARLRARDLGYTDAGLSFSVAQDGHAPLRVETGTVGDYNVGNLLAVLGVLGALGVPLADAVRALDAITPVPGRMECVGGHRAPLVAVDYAHTPDALDKALAALRPLAARRGGRLWCVFGCGGDRYPGKRPLMARIAQQGADRVVFTSDNPRSEPLQSILDQMLAGLPTRDRVAVQPDRALAIAGAVAEADPADVVLVAGKGHETYQETAGVREPFSDRAQAEAALARRGVAA